MLTLSCWGANIIVASTSLTQMENTTPVGGFWVLCRYLLFLLDWGILLGSWHADGVRFKDGVKMYSRVLRSHSYWHRLLTV